MQPLERMYTTETLAELLDQTPDTIRRWAIDGRIRSFRPGRQYLFLESDVQRLLAASEVKS